MRIKYFLFAFAFLFKSASFAQSYNFMFDGISRTYLVHLPTGYSAVMQYPLVINMHGYGSNSWQQQAYSQMNFISDTAKFVLVYPDGVDQGSGQAWNLGFGINSTINDVGFLSALIDTLKSKFSIDSARVYSCGMSMGGFMSYRLACEMPGRIAAIASVTGLMSDSTDMSCQNYCAVPVMDFHGTDDPIVDYNGAYGYLSVDETIQRWVQKNGCNPVPVITSMADINTSDSCTATKYYYGSGTDSSEVIFYKITNGGHTWPGFPYSVNTYGKTNLDVKASVEIWNFFRRHRIRCTASSINENAEENVLPQVYPNPFSDKLSISGAGAIRKIALVNLLGQVIFETRPSINGTLIALETNHLSPGLYVLHTEKNNGMSKSFLLVKP